MPDRTPAQIIRDAYATPGPEAVQRMDRRRRELAATYRPDARLDRLLALRDRDPAAYARVADPTTTISLGSYQAARAAHEEVQRDDN